MGTNGGNMAKRTIFNIMPALAAIATAAALLASCGEGEPSDINDRNGAGKDFYNALENLEAAIKNCQSSAPNPACPNPADFLSSTAGGSSSSGTEPGPGGSSSSGIAPNPIPSSGSVKPPPPVTEKEPENPCDVPDYTCQWEPASVPSGDKAKLTITYLGAHGKPDGCWEEDARKNIEIQDWWYKYAYFPVGEDIVTTGRFAKHDPIDPMVMDSSDVENWPEKGTLTVEGHVRCKDPAGTCNEFWRRKPCTALTITEVPAPIYTGDITCPWTVLPQGNNNLAIGTNITGACTASGSISNETAAKCTGDPITIKVTGSTANVSTVKVQAVANCKNNPNVVLKEVIYNVVADPSLKGGCEWDFKNNTMGGGNKAPVKAAPTIENQYGRACTGPYFTVGGTQKDLVSAGLTVDAWNGTAAQTMTGIAIASSCTGTSSITCPAITVKDPDATCEYNPAWCDGTAIENVKINMPSSQITSGGCYYVKNITATQNVYGKPPVLINGVGSNPNPNDVPSIWGYRDATTLSSMLPEDADGGYYVSIPPYGMFSGTIVQATDISPNCK
jgi:hypothetical protein